MKVWVWYKPHCNNLRTDYDDVQLCEVSKTFPGFLEIVYGEDCESAALIALDDIHKIVHKGKPPEAKPGPNHGKMIYTQSDGTRVEVGL